jgi:hypothetical protein
MISVTRSRANSGSRNRNRSAENANAAIEQLTSWPTVLRIASLNEFRKNEANGSAFHMSA